MSIYLGSTSISNAYLGSSAVSAIYLGSNQIWTSGPPFNPTSIIIGGLGGLTPAYTQANLETALVNETITSFTSQSGTIYADSSTQYSMSAAAFSSNTNITSYRDASGCVGLGTSLASGFGSFRAATNLTLVSLPSASLIGANTFLNCTALVSASLLGSAGIGAGAFDGCTNLSYVSIPSASTIGQNAFRNTLSLRNISLPIATSIGTTAFQQSYFLSGSFPNVTTLGANAFFNAFSASYINLSGLTALNAFDFTPFSGIGSALVNNIEYGFPKRTGTIIVPSSYLTLNAGSPPDGLSLVRGYPRNYYIDYVMSNNVFIGGCAADLSQAELAANCWQGSRILTYTQAGSDVNVTTDFSYDVRISGFENFTTMTSYIDGGRCLSLQNRAFFGCSALVTASFARATTVNELAFSGSTALKKINIPAVTSIRNFAFAGCSLLTMPDLQSTTTIGNYAFMSCSSLPSNNNIYIANLQTIGTGAFASASLNNLFTPNVTSVGAKAFENCHNLTYIELPGLVGANALGGSPSDNGVFTNVPSNGQITVPSYLEQSNNGGLDGDLDYLQNTKNWFISYI
jgi:hypothetical protein